MPDSDEGAALTTFVGALGVSPSDDSECDRAIGDATGPPLTSASISSTSHSCTSRHANASMRRCCSLSAPSTCAYSTRHASDPAPLAEEAPKALEATPADSGLSAAPALASALSVRNRSCMASSARVSPLSARCSSACTPIIAD